MATSTVRIAGSLGGALAVAGGIAALVNGSADTVVIGGTVTVAAGLAAMAGAVFANARPGWLALLLIATALATGLVAPGVIPAIGDSVVILLGYLAGATLLLVAAVLAFVGRNRAATIAVS